MPGYGFSMAFFQTYWNVIKDDIMGAFHEYHENGRFGKSINARFIALIPQKPNAMEVNDY